MSSDTQSKTAMAKTIISAVGTLAATVMVVRNVARDYLPPEIKDYFHLGLQKFFRSFSSQLTMVINEYDGIKSNEMYHAAMLYLGSKASPATRRLRVIKPENENMSVAMERNEEVLESFNGIQFKWTWVCQPLQTSSRYYTYRQSRSARSEIRYFELSFNHKHREEALNSYFPFILKQAKEKEQETKTLKIFTLDLDDGYASSDSWQSVSFDHPATFETLAMDGQLKDRVMKDLESFVKRRDKYRKVGKAWKRGYLLYGPPGTGKSSLIAAMANYLKFDIYDLELTDLKHNSDLRKLLIATANRSILVVEDIDCTIELQDRVSGATKVGKPADKESHGKEASKVTLSGFLNFIDGLWSSCGDERIVIFTTNHKERLDPALLRPGRMDMHIHMSYCTPCGFKLLATNYLGVGDHRLFKEIEDLIRTTKVTPAEVAEQLLQSDEADVSLASLISFMHTKSKETEDGKAKKAREKVIKLVSEAGQDSQTGDQN